MGMIKLEKNNKKNNSDLEIALSLSCQDNQCQISQKIKIKNENSGSQVSEEKVFKKENLKNKVNNNIYSAKKGTTQYCEILDDDSESIVKFQIPKNDPQKSK